MNAFKLNKFINTLLILCVIGNIVTDVVNVGVWIGSPSSQASLKAGAIAKTFGAFNGLIIGAVILLAVSIVYAAGLFGLLRKQRWAALLVVAISVANRAVAVLIFEFTFPVFYAWTVALVIVASLDYWFLSKPPEPLPQAG